MLGRRDSPSPSRPASLQIEPASLYFSWVGQSQQLAAEALGQAGRAVEGQTVSWSSSDPSVVTVSPALAIYRVLLTHEIAQLVQANAYVFGGSAEKTIWEIEGGGDARGAALGVRSLRARAGSELGHAQVEQSEGSRAWPRITGICFPLRIRWPDGGSRAAGPVPPLLSPYA